MVCAYICIVAFSTQPEKMEVFDALRIQLFAYTLVPLMNKRPIEHCPRDFAPLKAEERGRNLGRLCMRG